VLQRSSRNPIGCTLHELRRRKYKGSENLGPTISATGIFPEVRPAARCRGSAASDTRKVGDPVMYISSSASTTRVVFSTVTVARRGRRTRSYISKSAPACQISARWCSPARSFREATARMFPRDCRRAPDPLESAVVAPPWPGPQRHERIGPFTFDLDLVDRSAGVAKSVSVRGRFAHFAVHAIPRCPAHSKRSPGLLASDHLARASPGRGGSGRERRKPGHGVDSTHSLGRAAIARRRSDRAGELRRQVLGKSPAWCEARHPQKAAGVPMTAKSLPSAGPMRRRAPRRPGRARGQSAVFQGLRVARTPCHRVAPATELRRVGLPRTIRRRVSAADHLRVSGHMVAIGRRARWWYARVIVVLDPTAACRVPVFARFFTRAPLSAPRRGLLGGDVRMVDCGLTLRSREWPSVLRPGSLLRADEPRELDGRKMSHLYPFAETVPRNDIPLLHLRSRAR